MSNVIGPIASLVAWYTNHYTTLSAAKASLTRDIKANKAELAWMKQSDSLYYHGESRIIQQCRLENEITNMEIARRKLDKLS